VKKLNVNHSKIKILSFKENNVINKTEVNQDTFFQDPLKIFSLSSTSSSNDLLKKIKEGSIALSKILKIKRGIELGQNALLI
jgi:hypothetical protein